MSALDAIAAGLNVYLGHKSNQLQQSKQQQLLDREFGLKQNEDRRAQEAHDFKLGALQNEQQSLQQQQQLDQIRQAKFQENLGNLVASGQLTDQQAQGLSGQILQGSDVGGGQEALNAILAANQGPSELDQAKLATEQARVASEEALEQQRLAAAEKSRRGPDDPAEIRTLQALGLDPTLENVTELRRAGASQVNVGNAPKPPTGYMFRNPDNPAEGVAPLPGGPADPSNPRNITEGQRKIEGFRKRAANAQEGVAELEAAGFNPNNLRDALASNTVGRIGQSDQAKAYDDFKQDWIRVALRKDSGAALTQEEVEEYSGYFPQVGDGPADIQRKARIRQEFIDGLATEAGAASKSGGGKNLDPASLSASDLDNLSASDLDELERMLSGGGNT